MQGTRIEPFIVKMNESNASDLFLIQGCPPSLRVEGKIIRIGQQAIEEKWLEETIAELLSDDQKHDFYKNLELNTALTFDEQNRYRANFYKQMHDNGIVIRRIKVKIPSIDELQLPELYKKFSLEKRGLILMVGGTGAGKSTSLASMLEYRNDNGYGHVITVEDPIEFVHQHKQCIFSQREIGIDTHSYEFALKNALRQSPDVIVIGEIRDKETMESALLFCETGHLCMATLHANNAAQAIERMVNFFPEDLHHQILITLSQNLISIVGQRLVENLEGNLSLATEIMLNQGLIKQLITEDKVKEIHEAMEKGREQGMHTFDQALLDMINGKKISIETALKESDNPNNLRLRVNQQRTLDKDTVKDIEVDPDSDITGFLSEEDSEF